MKQIYSLVKLNAAQVARLAELREMNNKHNTAWRKNASFSTSGASSASAAQQALIRAECGFDFTNEERGELEKLEFLSNPPERYFAYPSADKKSVTDFMGNTLLVVTHLGREWRANMGDTRQSFHAVGINGIRYFGTIYGTYCRLRVCAEAIKN